MSIYTMIPFLKKIIAICLAVAAQANAAQARQIAIRNIMEHSVYPLMSAIEDGFDREIVESIDWSGEKAEFIAETMADGAWRGAAEDAEEHMFGEAEDAE